MFSLISSSSSSSTSSDEENELLEAYYRKLVRKPRGIRTRQHFMETLQDAEFQARFRLDKRTVLKVLDEIAEEINPPSLRNNAVGGLDRLLLALEFYATGCFLKNAAKFCGVSEGSAFRFIIIVSEAIARLRNRYVTFPNEPGEIARMKDQFHKISGFPEAVAAVSCMHVKISCPSVDDPEAFRNAKGFHSINVQVICDANMRLLDVVSDWPGSTENQEIFDTSKIKNRLDGGEFGDALLLGHSGYENAQYLVTPLENPTTKGERLYNESHNCSHKVVEKCVELMKRRFPILSVGMRCKLKYVFPIIDATTVLHNIALLEGINLPDNTAKVSSDDIVPSPQANLGTETTRRRLIATYFDKL